MVAYEQANAVMKELIGNFMKPPHDVLAVGIAKADHYDKKVSAAEKDDFALGVYIGKPFPAGVSIDNPFKGVKLYFIVGEVKKI